MMILIAYIYTYAKNSQLYLYISLFQQTIYIGGNRIPTDFPELIIYFVSHTYPSLDNQIVVHSNMWKSLLIIALMWFNSEEMNTRFPYILVFKQRLRVSTLFSLIIVSHKQWIFFHIDNTQRYVKCQMW